MTCHGCYLIMVITPAGSFESALCLDISGKPCAWPYSGPQGLLNRPQILLPETMPPQLLGRLFFQSSKLIKEVLVVRVLFPILRYTKHLHACTATSPRTLIGGSIGQASAQLPAWRDAIKYAL